ncbi:MAG: hypothetical protein FWC27_09570 [Firmicutes bacterium]|nr:hypothetical protein [Bacillota bacterium]
MPVHVPEIAKEISVITHGHFTAKRIWELLENTKRLTYGNAGRETSHHFTDYGGAPDAQETFRIMRDIKDAIIEKIHIAEAHLFYNRIELENVFLFLRYMLIYEGRLTLWSVPDSGNERQLRHFQAYNPFCLYREIFAALLVPYWAASLHIDSVQAEHIRQTVAEYFAQLFPWHPCDVLAERGSCSEKKLPRKPTCGDSDFPQTCSPRPDAVLIAAFADCVERYGCVAGAASMDAKAVRLLETVFEHVRLPSVNPRLTDTHSFLLWFFLADYLATYTSDLAALLRDHVPCLASAEKCSCDAYMAESYAAALLAGGKIDTGYNGGYLNWLNDRAIYDVKPRLDTDLERKFEDNWVICRGRRQ